MALIGLLVAASVVTPSAANPLANAIVGDLQCYRPDVVKKTCQSIASYQETGPGTYDNKATLPISTDVTLETHTPVVIKGDAVCGFIREQDIVAGTLRAKGQPIDRETAKPMLAHIAQSIDALSNAEICTRYEQSGSDFTAKVSVAGNYRPDQDVIVKWIGAADGYTVTP